MAFIPEAYKGAFGVTVSLIRSEPFLLIFEYKFTLDRRQVANVLPAAHAAGITHRDLKPDNLCLAPDAEVLGGERVKVLDFGIAKLAGEVGVKTSTGLVMGTPKYMSPEQCHRANTARRAVGRLFARAASCSRWPADARRSSAGLGYRRRAHLHAAPPYPQDLAPDMPAGLSALIATMLAKHPDARPQRMTTVSQTLDEILRTLGGSSGARSVAGGLADAVCRALANAVYCALTDAVSGVLASAVPVSSAVSRASPTPLPSRAPMPVPVPQFSPTLQGWAGMSSIRRALARADSCSCSAVSSSPVRWWRPRAKARSFWKRPSLAM
jgi:hypothetical protein